MPWKLVDHRMNASSQPAPKPSNQGNGAAKWKTYIALATVPMVLVLGNSMLVPILPDMEGRLAISRFQSSLIITLFSVMAGLFIPFAGYLSDRFTRKAIILPSLAVYGLAGIVAGFGALWGSYGLIIAARAVQGLGAAGTAPIAMALVGDLYRDGNESEALGLIEASNGFGKVVSPILGSLFALIVWYAPFFAFPAFCALSFIAVLWMIDEPKAKQKPPAAGAYVSQIGHIFREKGRWLVPAFFSGALALFILFGVLFYLSDLLEKPPYGIEGVAKGGMLAIPLLGLVVSSLTTGRILKKKASLSRAFMNIGLLMIVITLAAAILLVNQMAWLIVLLTLSSIGTGLLLPCLNTIITGSVDRQHRGMITSLYSSLRFFGVAFGPPIFGWLSGRSERLLFASVAVLALLTLGFTFWLVRPSAQGGQAGQGEPAAQRPQ
ncbi:MFS transporter [Paenibacillus sabuli]